MCKTPVKKLALPDFDYPLTTGQIAQHPLNDRTQSRLLVINRRKQTYQHHHFSDLKQFLNAGDFLVTNNSKVIPARLLGHKKKTSGGSGGGGKVEIFLVAPQSFNASATPATLSTKNPPTNAWQVLMKGKNLKTDQEIVFKEGLIATIIGKNKVAFSLSGTAFWECINAIGTTPLPPYIKRQEDDPRHDDDRHRYQTIFAQHDGSVAAPTAGLHFSSAMLETLKKQEVEHRSVTLHVGLGTFLPVKSNEIAAHTMHAERFYVDSHHAAEIAAAKKAQKQVICVGTTAFRALESVVSKRCPSDAWSTTDLFIYPKSREDRYTLQCCTGLLTNFHQPKSTLFMLISAILGVDFTHAIYAEARKNNYRFFSYGDAMLIL